MSDTAVSRQQLTLFVAAPHSAVLESIRQRLDPMQHRLIPVHVTLCREDELVARFGTALAALHGLSQRPPLTLQFGPPEPFDGHGVRLPCIDGESQFHDLRATILGSDNIRLPRAHITMAHPRNPRAPENRPATYASVAAPLTLALSRLALIKQVGQQPWQVLEEIALMGSG